MCCLVKAVRSLPEMLKDAGLVRKWGQLCFSTVAWVKPVNISYPTPRRLRASLPVLCINPLWVFLGPGLGFSPLLPAGFFPFCRNRHLPGKCPGTANRQPRTLSLGHSSEKAFPGTDGSDLCSTPNADEMEGLSWQLGMGGLEQEGEGPP